MNKIGVEEEKKNTASLNVTDAQTGKVTEHEIEVKPLTVICHQGALEIEPTDDNVSVITAVDTVGVADSLNAPTWNEIRANKRFIKLFKVVFEFDPPEKLVTKDTKHITGMILLIFMTLAKGKRPFLKLPETHLHPKQQAAIADMLVMIQKGE